MVRPKPTFPKERNNAPVVQFSAFKKPLERILIVCEDSVSGSCGYFRGFLKDEGLGRVVTIDRELGNAPTSVYERAAAAYKKDFQQQGNNDDAYDKVYCIFDRDGHSDFHDAINQIKNHPSKKFQAIPSYPCFEVWILLHYADTSAPLNNCRKVEKEIKKYLPNYSKKDVAYKDGLYALIKANTQAAIKNAKKNINEAEKTGDCKGANKDPKTVTEIYIVVEHLLKLADANI
jgi:hypothetical protein